MFSRAGLELVERLIFWWKVGRFVAVSVEIPSSWRVVIPSDCSVRWGEVTVFGDLVVEGDLTVVV